MSPYYLVIGLSLLIIFSYFFNLLAKKTNIPSVLLLIITGIIISQVLSFSGIDLPDVFPFLEIIGIVGLIMIVLEAALDLELTINKLPLLLKSFIVAFVSLILNIVAFTFVISGFFDCTSGIAVLYSIPLAITSSAIVIPSVVNLPEHNKEFLVLEGTFSDIFGIMIFYFTIDYLQADTLSTYFSKEGQNIILTLLISLIASYGLVLIFQRITTQIKLFLLIAVLLVLYSIGKLFHLSSLLIILIFGLILNNPKVFFPGFLQKLLHKESLQQITSDFKLVTLETSFVVRTFFFVLFGMSLVLSSLFNVKVILVSMLVLGLMYIIRFLVIRTSKGKKILPDVLVSPRGLITILLFYAIPSDFMIEDFSSGIVLFVILVSSGIMGYGLILESRNRMYGDLEKEFAIEVDLNNEDSAEGDVVKQDTIE